jgi:hypothetical protein
MKVLGMMVLLVAVAGLAVAQTAPAPEIDPGSAGTAIALLSGALLVARARQKK